MNMASPRSRRMAELGRNMNSSRKQSAMLWIFWSFLNIHRTSVGFGEAHCGSPFESSCSLPEAIRV